MYGFLGSAPFFLSHLQAIFATRLALGLVEAVILTVVNTLLGDYFAPDARRKWLTVQGVTGPVLGTTCIALSGPDGTILEWRLSHLPGRVPDLSRDGPLFYEPQCGNPEILQQVSDFERPFPIRKVLGYCGATIFTATIYYVFLVQGGLAFEAIGVTSAGRLGVLIGIASMGVPVGALLFGLFSKRWSTGQLLAFTLGCFGIGLLGIGLVRDYRIMTAFALLQQLGSGMAVPTLVYWATRVLPSQQRGRGMGWWVSAFFAGQFLSPAVVGLVRGMSGGILSAFIVMGALAIVGAIASLVSGDRSATQGA